MNPTELRLPIEPINDDELTCVFCRHQTRPVDHAVSWRRGGERTWWGVHIQCVIEVMRRDPRPVFACIECGRFPDAPIFKDEIWETIAAKKDLLCISCTEKRLGRPFEITDLRNCAANAPLFHLMQRFAGIIDQHQQDQQHGTRKTD